MNLCIKREVAKLVFNYQKWNVELKKYVSVGLKLFLLHNLFYFGKQAKNMRNNKFQFLILENVLKSVT
jgi:hypothetical protein